MKRIRIDEEGNKYGRLTVVALSHVNNRNETHWKCLCDCGKEIVVNGCNLRTGNTKSCGCWNRDLLRNRAGSNHPNWKGGLTLERVKDWKSLEYKQWRKEVFERDKHTCQMCGKVGGDLEAHHIWKWKPYDFCRYEVWNGITLCKEGCHDKTKHHEAEYIHQFAVKNKLLGGTLVNER